MTITKALQFCDCAYQNMYKKVDEVEPNENCPLSAICSQLTMSSKGYKIEITFKRVFTRDEKRGFETYLLL